MSFVIGQWVCGPRFFGREAEIAALLGSSTRWQWIAGLRRIGKTSLLKQLDHLTAEDARKVPLFWDLQGIESDEELGLTFTDALLDSQETLARQGISPEEIEDGDVFRALEKLAHALRDRGTELLLLCDEADELMTLERNAPGLVDRLWTMIDSFASVRVVLASSLRLCDAGASLVERFKARGYLGVMTDGEARSLLRQEPAFDAACAETLRDACGNHPMLLQIAAKRCLEVGDAEEALRQVAADRSVQHLLSVDFDLLASAERQILRSIAAGDAVNAGPASVERLLRLGLIHGSGSCGFIIPNRFLAAWLRDS
jgi:hypothetical protein